ncbi:MAG: hypothetical protein D6736_18510 [Nitrospinota bacterium]|nr:MAG: hypothetical protein D6736_18510 [Nitrospinota bacterium]
MDTRRLGEALLDCLEASEGNYLLIRRGKVHNQRKWKVNVRIRGREIVSTDAHSLIEALHRAARKLRRDEEPS